MNTALISDLQRFVGQPGVALSEAAEGVPQSESLVDALEVQLNR